MVILAIAVVLLIVAVFTALALYLTTRHKPLPAWDNSMGQYPIWPYTPLYVVGDEEDAD